MKWFWLGLQIVLVLIIAAAAFLYLINRQISAVTAGKAKDSITEIKTEDLPRVALVFGAGVQANGEPSPALYDRVVTAVELYRAGRVRKLLMSGDNRFANYNEPAAMKETAVKLGVPAENIVEDFAGRRTYDSCFRAKNIFNVSRAILVTQQFHLNRAIYLCESIGIDSVGIRADRRQYEESARNWWTLRENLALVSAWFEINVSAATPVLGEKEPIAP